VASNDDWGGSAALTDLFAMVGAFPLPADSRDAVVSGGLAAGVYTLQVTGKDNARRIALAEIYDASPTPAAPQPRIVNISTRAAVGTGSDVLIAGFVIGGSTSKTLLIRGIGPSLASHGVAGAIEDPDLSVYAGARRIAGNDDWGGDETLGMVSFQVGAFPLGSFSKDSALVLTLAPGAYTAQLAGVGATSGVGLVEIYEVP
jgi:hypothetical protein